MKSEEEIRKTLKHHRETIDRVKREGMIVLTGSTPHRTMTHQEMEAMIKALEWVLK